MVDLARHYAEHGLLLETSVFAAPDERLRERCSDYAAVLGALLALAGVKPDRDVLEELRASTPSDEPALIDEEWEEKEVTLTGRMTWADPPASSKVDALRVTSAD